ncbi:methylmalonyl-CoA mutase family protein [Algoriphagus zhangzhouensis]|uniref:Methylmalonyl-CoA mutase n=1 Tax=Algoriphagus zhangzhouensis TaxID=1073327 RepID=A0A1M7ZK90_9BACT|nr:methylmalonyl-CoA mutase family protein [Algoriphagus zhangzhouensis]TDY43115.1 heterodimeric methylmalonyl-CoA mutase small subunit [Algoriphagus zhangzhouensis]SHO65229.1 methylmalonyl-CoA mutase [Algoriphagus zhangzhouensis]
MTEKDFYPFKTTSKIDWKSQIEKDLKGKDFNQTLVKTIWNEIQQQPFYTSEDLKEKPIQNRFSPPAEIPGLPPRTWSTSVSISPSNDKTENKEILAALENGADAIVMELDRDPNWSELLKDVLLPYIHIYLKPLQNAGVIFLSFSKFIQQIDLNQSDLHGGFLWSPTGDLLETNGDFEKKIALTQQVISDWKEYPSFYPICVDFSTYRNSGGTGIQELTFGFGEIIEIVSSLTDLGIEAKTCFENMMIHSSVAEEFFPEIAKLKSLRNLFSSVANQFDAKISAENIHLICSTSTWSHSFLDKNSNLIRQTYEAMASVLGGSNSIWVIPTVGENSNTLEKRIAKNVSLILKEESYLDKVVDPSSGSYYLGSLESEICGIVQSNIVNLESKGGWLMSFQTRELQTSIRETRVLIQNQILNETLVKVGANKYQPSKKLENNIEFLDFQEEEFQLSPTRASYLLEKSLAQ